MLSTRTATAGLAGLVALAVAVPLGAVPASPAAANGLGGSASPGAGGDPPPIESEVKLTAADGAHGDLFGQAVAVDGDTAIVGARSADVGGNQDQGAVYVFARDGEGWVERQKLVAGDGAPLDEFGTQVALSGDTALVGAASHQGAYVFTRADGVWSERAKLTRSDGPANDYYGTAVALSADGATAVVGAWAADVGGNVNQGKAYVFTRDGDGWTERAQLLASDGHEWAVFGVDVAISPDGRTIVVGAELARAGENDFQGQAYVFTRDGDGWVERAILSAADGAANDRFGSGVAVAGDTVLVGASETQSGGAAYVFTRDGETWTQRATLHGSAVTPGGWFGHRVALSATGDTAVVGARHSRQSVGSAYVFTHADGEWREELMLTAGDEGPNHQFGNAVAIDGGTILVGAWTSRVGEVINQGSAYAYEVETSQPPPDPSEPVGCDETVTGPHPGPLTVDDGVTCLAAGARVLGEVNVLPGAGLRSSAAVVQGPVSALGAALVSLSFTQVTGPVLASGTTGEVWLLGNQVTGSVSIVGSATGDRAVVVSGNTVIGSLSCFGNTPAPTDQGLPNVATGGAFGQCAAR
jgi:hypothetical protein